MSKTGSNYRLEEGAFVIEDYDKAAPFTSFLPGLAGVKGIPMWTFYVNRGQAMTSFGINKKDNSIMEFNVAIMGYENTDIKGFRTFVKANGKYTEAFCEYGNNAKRVMKIERNVCSVKETNPLGFEINVEYMVLPNENIGALVRNVTIKNILDKDLDLEVFDGTPHIIPFGMGTGMYKHTSNLFRSWAEVINVENKIPCYRLNETMKAPEAETMGMHYYCSIVDGKLTAPIYDPECIFGFETSLRYPERFLNEGFDTVLSSKQHPTNKIGCGFTPVKKVLKAGESLNITTFIGYSDTPEFVNTKAAAFVAPGYVSEKFRQARELSDKFTADITSKSGKPLFDEYAKSCYMDNFLRGGYPFVFNPGKDASVVHLFSRRHGDPERDYNDFAIAGEYYSQGNGNFRDVAQNRRNDVFFNKNVGDFNVYSFYNYIQLDGYNPLKINPCTFVIKEGKEEEAKALIAKHVQDPEGRIEKLVSGPFMPGQISNLIAVRNIPVQGNEDELISGLLKISHEQLEASFGEGYWSDHWDYNLDLVENYLMVFPDKEEELLYGRNDYKFYDSEAVVLPRSETYVDLGDGKIRQRGSSYIDPEKCEREGFVPGGTNWAKDPAGKVVTTSLMGKMVTLAANKVALLDMEGIGISMDGGNPGWNDAMGGVPFLFGSGFAETCELKRFLDYMDAALGKDFSEGKTVILPKEVVQFTRDIYNIFSSDLTLFERWDKASDVKEAYRESIRLKVSGEQESIETAELKKIIECFKKAIDEAVERAYDNDRGIVPTFLARKASKWETVLNADGTPHLNHLGLPTVKVTAFEPFVIPRSLEGPARVLCASGSAKLSENKEMHAHIKASDLYDKKLKMYKTSESIENMPLELGNCRIFTPGWLERESIFVHLEYKYFLGLIKAGLYDEYYEAVNEGLIPFTDPAVYGRSILENSSFIASSVNPDETLHGRGFQARLSGSTSEVVSMWIKMYMGNGGYRCGKDGLELVFDPKLSADMFDSNGEATFTLGGKTPVTYINRSGKATYGEKGAKITKIAVSLAGKNYEFEGNTITGIAEQVRNNEAEKIVVTLD
ncbi:MAG: cellobiose phosphorylase [Lachnospiraceae bacterium]|nr:cellobiose phosphorylase [Lachnospiraceae bacterium]